MTRGAFIVVEGLDRSGKSTQTTALCNRLTSLGKSVKLYNFPDRTTATGKMIDSYLRSQSDLDDRAIHLIFSANRWEAAETMIKELEAGTNIICDRYAFSGIAFSTAKSLPSSSSSNDGSTITTTPSNPTTTSTNSPTSTTKTLTYEWCRAPDTSLPAPDLVLFLDVTPEVQAARGGYGQERYEKADLQRRVREVFRKIAEEFRALEDDTSSPVVRWREIDASRSKEDVGNEIWTAIRPLVENGAIAREIGRLWENVQH